MPTASADLNLPHLTRLSKVSRAIDVPERTLRDWAHRGELPGAVRIGGKILVNVTQLRTYLERANVSTKGQNAA